MNTEVRRCKCLASSKFVLLRRRFVWVSIATFAIALPTMTFSSEGLFYFSMYAGDADAFNVIAIARCKEVEPGSAEKYDEALAKWRSINKVSADRVARDFQGQVTKKELEEFREWRPKVTKDLVDKWIASEKISGAWCRELLSEFNSGKKDRALGIIENELRKAGQK